MNVGAGRLTAVSMGLVAAWSAHSVGAAGEGLVQQIDRVLAPLGGTTATYGVAVVDLTDDAVVFQRGAERALIPASNQKLLVMAAALEILGPTFAFRTIVGRRGRDLVIVGDGDPALGDDPLCAARGDHSSGFLERWASAVRSSGWDRIEGDLILDESIFDDQWIHPSWEPVDRGKWYGAPVGALNLHDNCVEVTLWPADRVGDAPLWRVDPPCALIELDNRARSAARGVPVIARVGETFRFSVRGACGSRATLKSVPVPDPGLFLADVLRGALERNGVPIDGAIRRERVRGPDGGLPDAFRIAAQERTPIADVLRRVGRDSQNLFAECLAKRIGYEHMRRTSSGTPKGGWVTAAAAMSAFLRGTGIDTDGLVISDASGLSRDNRVSAEQIVRVLTTMHNHPAAAMFASNLAVAGAEGSLRGRMKDIRGLVLGKTGTLRGVKSLSGYVMHDGKRRFAFSMIVNDIHGATGPIKRVQDELCRVLANHDD